MSNILQKEDAPLAQAAFSRDPWNHPAPLPEFNECK